MNFHVSPPRILAILVCAAALIGVPSATSAQSGPLFLTGFPLLRQQHSLTCESAATSMGTRGQISESQIMRVLPRDPNPNLGFRGNPDGQQGTALADYGVYAGPVSQALLHYNYRSDVLRYSTDATLRSYLNKGWPVVVWIPYALQPTKPRLVQRNGMPFVLAEHEHTVLLVGYDKLTVFANDPWTATVVRYFWRDFNRGWGAFGNMALAIEPCPMTKPVDPLQLSNVTDTSATWSWNTPPNASTFDVTVTRHMKKTIVVYHGVQSTPTITVNDLRPRANYTVSVRALSACGDMASPVTLSVMLPAVPSVTPSPTAGPSGTPQPSPVASGTPVSTAVPSLSATPKP